MSRVEGGVVGDGFAAASGAGVDAAAASAGWTGGDSDTGSTVAGVGAVTSNAAAKAA